ncbi:MAG TPA: hypothetical protein VM370_05955 [Candidatus Thermoplasmatota archaeon]|nr:hypothetical protein [Candidatus Thermoplasmatota archaeon]
MGLGPSLDAWGKHGRFSYAGDLERGTRILYGRTKVIVVAPELYAELLARFAGKVVAIGASRRPARGSLGSWLKTHLGVELAVVYVGPILVREGAAERVDETTLRFL